MDSVDFVVVAIKKVEAEEAEVRSGSDALCLAGDVKVLLQVYRGVQKS